MEHNIRRSLRRAAGAILATVLGATPAQAAWFEARTRHFVVYSDDSEAEVRAFATRLERFDAALRLLQRLPDAQSASANPLTVYVVPDVAAVQRLCDQIGRRTAACNDVAGFYSARAEGSVAFTPRRSGSGDRFELNAQTVLFHEYSHHFMLENASAAYPAWFVEGFAEFNSTARFYDDGAIGFGLPAFHRYYGLLSRKPLPLAVMLAPDGRTLRGEQREAVYGRGWLLAHYLTFSKERQGQLPKYLAAINTGQASVAAAKAAFGDIDALDGELDRYLRRPKLAYMRLAATILPTGTVDVRRLTRGEAAMMPVRMRSDRSVDAASAARVVVEARSLAAPFADDPRAQDALAEAEFDAGNDTLADAAADRALVADPKDRVAMLYKGQVAMRRATIAKSTDPAVWKAARGWFARANRLAPDDAAPLMFFYLSFAAEGRKPTANAITGLEYAFQLVPQDAALRWLLVRQYLLDGELAKARARLVTLAYNPHAAADNVYAALVALIDQGDSAAVIAKLKSIESQPAN